MLMVCPPKVIAFGLCAIMTQRAGETLYRLRSRNPNRCILTGLFSTKGGGCKKIYQKGYQQWLGLLCGINSEP